MKAQQVFETINFQRTGQSKHSLGVGRWQTIDSGDFLTAFSAILDLGRRNAKNLKDILDYVIDQYEIDPNDMESLEFILQGWLDKKWDVGPQGEFSWKQPSFHLQSFLENAKRNNLGFKYTYNIDMDNSGYYTIIYSDVKLPFQEI